MLPTTNYWSCFSGSALATSLLFFYEPFADVDEAVYGYRISSREVLLLQMNEQSKSCYSGVRTNNGRTSLVDCFSIGKSEQLSKSERIFLSNKEFRVLSGLQTE